MNITVEFWKINLINWVSGKSKWIRHRETLLKKCLLYVRCLKVGIWKTQMKLIWPIDTISVAPLYSFTCHCMMFFMSFLFKRFPFVYMNDSLLFKSCKATKSHGTLWFFTWAQLMFIKCFSCWHVCSVLINN